MAKLMGAQPMVLQAILDASADILSFVEDSQIARTYPDRFEGREGLAGDPGERGVRRDRPD